MKTSSPDDNKWKTIRRVLHQYPEVSGNEKQTSGRIVDYLKQYSPDSLITNLGGHGVIAVYEGKEKGKNILIRCELDALPIDEINTFSHQSAYPGISHKCGHDGHMAILIGLAASLYKDTIQKGRVYLLFQPAEEDGTGAEKIWHSKEFQKLSVDYVFALHNLPGYPKHTVVLKESTFSCAVSSIAIFLKGKTSHAGEPEKGINPSKAIASLLTYAEEKSQKNIEQEDYILITPIHIKMGEKAYGVSAGEAEIHFTLRCRTNEEMELHKKKIEDKILEIEKNSQLKCNWEWVQPFQATENNPVTTNIVRLASKELSLPVEEKNQPFSWGEDFGLFTQNIPGTLFGLGAGKNIPALHNPDYDFPDDIIHTGICLFKKIIQNIQDA